MLLATDCTTWTTAGTDACEFNCVPTVCVDSRVMVRDMA